MYVYPQHYVSIINVVGASYITFRHNSDQSDHAHLIYYSTGPIVQSIRHPLMELLSLKYDQFEFEIRPVFRVCDVYLCTVSHRLLAMLH